MRTWHALFGLVCLPGCALMAAEMLLSFGMYSGRAATAASRAKPTSAH